jgi:adenylate cyclase
MRMKSWFGSFLGDLRGKKIIEILAAFIGGGWLIIEFVDRILVAHYHFPDKTIDISFITLLCALICTLLWRWFTGREKSRGFKLGRVLIPLVLLVTVLLDINLLLHLRVPETETFPPSKWKNSVAVLPFKDMSPQKDQDWFCEGITGEIINRLTNISELKVPARTSAFFFKGKDEDIRDIGRKLGVGTVLEGSIQKVDTRLRILIDLVNIADGANIWSQEFDKDSKDVFAIQREIALAVADKLKVTFLGNERARVVDQPINDIGAYELYMKGKYHRYAELPRDMLLARDYFERAIQIQPNFAMALAGLAENYMIMGLYTVLPRDEARGKAMNAAERALALDPDLSQAHVSMGVIKMVFDWDWPSAEDEFRKAIDLNPNNFDAYREYALLLFRNHRYDESERTFLYASKIDPLNAVLFRDLRTLYICMGQADRAEEVRKTLMTMRPDWAQPWFDYREVSVEAAMAAIRDQGRYPTNIATLAITYLVQGKRDEGKNLIEELEALFEKGHEGNVALSLTGLYEELGDKNTALAWFERALEQKAPGLCDISRCVYHKSLQGEPRYQAVLSKVGFK